MKRGVGPIRGGSGNRPTFETAMAMHCVIDASRRRTQVGKFGSHCHRPRVGQLVADTRISFGQDQSIDGHGGVGRLASCTESLTRSATTPSSPRNSTTAQPENTQCPPLSIRRSRRPAISCL